MSSTPLPAAPHEGGPRERRPHERTLVLRIVEHPRGQQETRFTVSVGETSGLRAICHVRPLPGALLSLASELSSAPLATGDAPDWSTVGNLVRELLDAADENSQAAAKWLEIAFAWAVNMGQKLELAQERVEILDLLVQELIKLAKPLTIGVEGSTVWEHWLKLESTYEGRQEFAPHIELAGLRELARSMAETVAIVNSLLAGASPKEDASIALWRTERLLRALGYQLPAELPPVPWAETTVEAQR